MKVLNWFSPRINGPAVIQINLDTDAALWIADNLPVGDQATLELFRAIAETSHAGSEGAKHD